ASARKLFASAFPADGFEVTSYGNVMAAAAFLYGLSVEELNASDLDVVDPNFPVIVAIRAVKPSAPRRSVRGGSSRATGVILVYHHIAEITTDTHILCNTSRVLESQVACCG